MARNLLKPNVRLALSMGDLHGAVFAQHANRYFELAPERYYAAVVRNYNALRAALNWPNLLLAPPDEVVAGVEGGRNPVPLSSGFLSSDWGQESSGELSEAEVLDHAENYLQGKRNV